MHEDFDAIDEAVFGKIVEAVKVAVASEDGEVHGVCTDCGTILSFDTISTWICNNCGRQTHAAGAVQDVSEESTGTIKVSNGLKRNYYNGSGNYASTQKRAILDQLLHNNEVYKGPKFPKDVLTQAANLYNETQQIELDEVDCEGNVNHRKFVKRGTVKNEILCKLVEITCKQAGAPRKKKEIAQFMHLPNQGYPRGEEILRALRAKGKIDIPINEDPTEDFIERYLEALGLDADEKSFERYKAFVYDIVATSFRKYIGNNSILTSRVVGAIWVLIQHANLDIPAATLEQACDAIRYHTFTKFSQVVDSNIIQFIDIFEKYKIPHGVRGRIVRKQSARP